MQYVGFIIAGNAGLLLRYRLKCVICRKDSHMSKIPHVKQIQRSHSTVQSKTHMLVSIRMEKTSNCVRLCVICCISCWALGLNCCTLSCFQVFNEVVVDRGQSPYLCNIDLYVEGKLVTTVQGDGECRLYEH